MKKPDNDCQTGVEDDKTGVELFSRVARLLRLGRAGRVPVSEEDLLNVIDWERGY